MKISDGFKKTTKLLEGKTSEIIFGFSVFFLFVVILSFKPSIVYETLGSKIGVFILTTVALVIFFTLFIYYIPEYYRGTKFRFGKCIKEVINPGLHFKLPVDRIEKTDCRVSEVKETVTPEFPLPDSSLVSYTWERVIEITNPFLFKKGQAYLSQFDRTVNQVLEQFTTDKKNPPRDYEEARDMDLIKYLAKIVAFFLNVSYPVYEDDDLLVPDIQNLPEEQRPQKGQYKKYEHMDTDEKNRKEDIINKTKLLMKGELESIDCGGEEIKKAIISFPSKGFDVIQMNVKKPSPGSDLAAAQKKINDMRQKIIEMNVQTNLEEAEQVKNQIEFDSFMSRVKDLIKEGVPAAEATRRVMLLDKDLTERLKSTTKEDINHIVLGGNLDQVLANATNLICQLFGIKPTTTTGGNS
jgi:hypothetical protein